MFRLDAGAFVLVCVGLCGDQLHDVWVLARRGACEGDGLIWRVGGCWEMEGGGGASQQDQQGLPFGCWEGWKGAGCLQGGLCLRYECQTG